ncbi:hypothetical protein HK099_001704, partial [Clydaea vesicula]
FLLEKKEKYPENFSTKFIDYQSLKTYIKEEIKPNDLSNLTTNNSTDFKKQVKSKLNKLEEKIFEFFNLIEIEVNNLEKVYQLELNSVELKFQLFFDNFLKKEKSASVNSDDNYLTFQNFLKDVVRLERFILLNYTGLKIGAQFIMTLTDLNFFKSVKLSNLKKQLIELVTVNNGSELVNSGTSTPTAVTLSKKNNGSSIFNTTLVEQSLNSLSLSIPASLTSSEQSSFPPPNSLLPNQKILISMNGPHGTDIIGAVLQCVSKYNLPVEDFVLSRLYHNVTFGCLTKINNESVQIFQDLNVLAKKWESSLFYDSYSDSDKVFNSLEDAPYQDRVKYTATVLNQVGLSSEFLFDFTRLLLDYKISVEKMFKLSGLQKGEMLCSADFKLSVPLNVDFDQFRADLFNLSGKHGTDVALQPNDVFRKSKRLVIFDMDSTLIQQEVIDEIAKHAGVVGEVAKITEAAMNGEIDFKESLKQRVALLKGTSVNVLEIVKEKLTFTEGAHSLCKALKKLGYKLAVISGGFMPLALHVKNHLVSTDGKTLTGETIGPIVDGMRKAELLDVIAQAESVSSEQVIAVGDGANDLWMLAAAGL